MAVYGHEHGLLGKERSTAHFFSRICNWAEFHILCEYLGAELKKKYDMRTGLNPEPFLFRGVTESLYSHSGMRWSVAALGDATWWICVFQEADGVVCHSLMYQPLILFWGHFWVELLQCVMQKKACQSQFRNSWNKCRHFRMLVAVWQWSRTKTISRWGEML